VHWHFTRLQDLADNRRRTMIAVRFRMRGDQRWRWFDIVIQKKDERCRRFLQRHVHGVRNRGASRPELADLPSACKRARSGFASGLWSTTMMASAGGVKREEPPAAFHERSGRGCTSG